jgi:hypothetical protein
MKLRRPLTGALDAIAGALHDGLDVARQLAESYRRRVVETTRARSFKSRGAVPVQGCFGSRTHAPPPSGGTSRRARTGLRCRRSVSATSAARIVRLSAWPKSDQGAHEAKSASSRPRDCCREATMLIAGVARSTPRGERTRVESGRGLGQGSGRAIHVLWTSAGRGELPPCGEDRLRAIYPRIARTAH